MDRRRFLQFAAGASPFLAGCSGEPSPSSPSRSASPTATRTPTGTSTRSETATSTRTPREQPDTIFVDATAGDRANPGTADAPLASIQRALERAAPGETVFVRPGVYRERLEPPTGGEPGAPITLTGPPDAVLRSDPSQYNVVLIRRSHFHLTGLTIDGLENPSAPDDVDSYSRAQLVQARPEVTTDAYLEDLVVAPHRIGNSQKALVSLERTVDSTVGPFRVIGPAGADYTVGDAVEEHNGEIVYLGTSPSNLQTDWHPWSAYDQTSGIRVHHIDNSDGYGHSELANTKLGTHDITVEYCTDGGGAQNSHEDSLAASIRFQSFDATVRWCVLQNGQAHGVEIASYKARDALQEKSDPSAIERKGGTGNSVYGNRITGFAGRAIAYPVESQTQADQRHVCGNEVEGATDGEPTRACPEEVPIGDGIGHTGGDSPWR